MCSKTLAKTKGLGQATISRIYAQFTVLKAKERLSECCPQVLGIDEPTLHKAKRFSTTLCDLKNHKIFDVVEGRSNSELETYFTQ
ncbi:transposase [Rubritalea spongiae]|uniref:Transposase n=1 Tax=Rubritalea spongiae TaxID=430797 RepID=A0ABW5E5R7_9BACT